MGIKVKYDPIGSAALATYAIGVNAGQERRQLQDEQLRLREGALDLGWQKLDSQVNPMPEGVAMNPDAARQWREFDRAERDIQRGRNFDPRRPDSQITLGRIQEGKRALEDKFPAPTPAERAMKNSYLGDQFGNPVPDGTPGARRWHVDPNNGQVTPWEQPKNDAERVQQDAARKAQQQADYEAWKRDDAAIRANPEIPSIYDAPPAPPKPGEPVPEPQPYRPTKEQLLDERRKAYDDKWGPGGTGWNPPAAAAPPMAEGGAPMAPPGTDPRSPVAQPGFDPNTYTTNGMAGRVPWKGTYYSRNSNDGRGYPEDPNFPIISPEEMDQANSAFGESLKNTQAGLSTPERSAPPPGAPQGEGANPTPENTDPPSHGYSPRNNAEHYAKMLKRIQGGDRINPRARDAFLADYMRRNPGQDPSKVTDEMILSELVYTYREMARRPKKGPDLGTSGRAAPQDMETVPQPATQPAAPSQVPVSAPPVASVPPGMPPAPTSQPPMRSQGQAVKPPAPAPASAATTAPAKPPAGSVDPGTSKGLFEAAVRRKPALQSHPLVQQALQIFAKQKRGTPFTEADALIIFQANELLKSTT